MRTLLFILQKEFRQIFRDPAIIRVIFIMPAIQLLVLPWAADYEVRNINLVIVDHDRGTMAQQLVGKITASGYFQLAAYTASYTGALHTIEANEADMVLEIPASFERDLLKQQSANLFIAVNAINGVKAGLGASYLQTIIGDYNAGVRLQRIQAPRFNAVPMISITSSNWFNPLMDYKAFMVPGILAMLVTMVGAFLAAGNIVKEKEIGTMEQINVTPIRKHHFILGKLIPFLVMGLVILSIGLLISYAVYGIVPAGSLLTVYVFTIVYLVAVLGLGLLVSTYCATQQQAMLISFFLMMIFILLSGLYTPIESMPQWAQWITKVNPVTYLIQVMRMVMLKGSGLRDILPQIYVMLIFGVVLNAWAVFSYHKRT